MSLIDDARRAKDRAEAAVPQVAERLPGIHGAATSGGGNGDTGTTWVIIKYDGSRSGTRYTGHIKEDDGDAGDLVEFCFANDPGEETLLDADDYVCAIPCPTWDEGNARWSGNYDRYWAVLSPWMAYA